MLKFLPTPLHTDKYISFINRLVCFETDMMFIKNSAFIRGDCQKMHFQCYKGADQSSHRQLDDTLLFQTNLAAFNSLAAILAPLEHNA